MRYLRWVLAGWCVMTAYGLARAVEEMKRRTEEENERAWEAHHEEFMHGLVKQELELRRLDRDLGEYWNASRRVWSVAPDPGLWREP